MNTISIPVKREYLDRNKCREEAARILGNSLIEGMTEKQLACEIYFHALVFYFCEKTGRMRWLKDHADPIDIRDGGDYLPMRILFSASWMTGRIIKPGNHKSKAKKLHFRNNMERACSEKDRNGENGHQRNYN